MSQQRVGGIIELRVNSQQLRAKGNFTYNLGRGMREGVVGADVVHGFKETPQTPFIEGEITDHADFDLEGLLETTEATITLTLANEKIVVLRDAWFAGEGTGNTEEGNVAVRFEGISAEMA